MKRLLATFLVAIAGASLSGCGQPARAPHPTAEPIEVTAAAAAFAETTEALEAGGVVASLTSATISSRLVAPVVSVRVQAGDRVRAGDVLLTLDAADLSGQAAQVTASALAADHALAQARADHRAAEADHRLAVSWHKRITALHARSSATDQERDEADARLASASARLAGLQAGIDAAAARLSSARSAATAGSATESHAVLRAPFAGLVTERLVDPGSLASPGIPLLRVDSDGARQVLVRIDEARASYVHPGHRVRVLIDAADAESGPELEGVVTEVARAVGADQRAFTVKVALPPAAMPRSGSFARVIFRGAARRALIVPDSAIRRQGQVTSVWVVREDVAMLRLVRTGAWSPDGVEVLAGLDAGESIVTSPSPRLVDGARIRVSQSAGPGAVR
jgi:RND family efflux transporter MFP subunit